MIKFKNELRSNMQNRKISLKNIKIRKLSPSDLKRAKEFLNFADSLIEEEAMVLLCEKKTLKDEKEWLRSKLKNIKNKKEVVLVAQDKNKIVGISHVELKRERQSHVGEFGISIRKEYRGIGLGKKLMTEILKLAKRELKPKFIRLSVYPQNKIAQNLYKKFGFKKVAKIPKQIQYKGKLVDEVIMIKEV